MKYNLELFSTKFNVFLNISGLIIFSQIQLHLQKYKNNVPCIFILRGLVDFYFVTENFMCKNFLLTVKKNYF